MNKKYVSIVVVIVLGIIGVFLISYNQLIAGLLILIPTSIIAIYLGIREEIESKKQNNFTSTFVENFETPSQAFTNPTNLDELKKLKDLLDSGAITQDEYNNKKQQLLNL